MMRHPPCTHRTNTLFPSMTLFHARVSSSGSPGPAPTIQTGEGLLYSSGIDWLPVFSEHRPDRWTAASAICARRESRSHGLNAGQLLVGNGLQYGPGPNVEAYAKDGSSILGRLGGSASEQFH